jgi:hypothetical protein
MATIPVNPTGIVTTTTATGSFAGFTVVSGSATITGLKDANGSELTTTDWIIPAGFTIPIYVTSASLSSGAIVLYP